MKSVLFILIILIQVDVTLGQEYYRIKLKSKDPNYSLYRPQDFLSERALDRRKRNDVKISVDDLPLDQQTLRAISKIEDVNIHCRLKWRNEIIVELNDSRPIEAIKELPNVEYLDKITEIPIRNQRSGNQKFFEEETKLRINYGSSWPQVGMLSVDDLHREGYTGDKVLIALFDAGYRHMDTLDLFKHLWERDQIKGQWDFVDNDDDALHGSNHGMQVLSTISALSSSRMVGIAPDAHFVLYRTEDIRSETRIEEYNWAAAAEYADSIGADIINSSLGYTRFDNPDENYSYEQMDGKTAICTQAAETAASKGIIVVNSAGNSGSGDWKYIGAPADGPNVFSVGAVNADQILADFSSRGPNSMNVQKPNVCAQGQGTAISGTTDSLPVVGSNGTSFSSPIIAGLCAVLLEANPNSNAKSVKMAIEQSAHLYQTPDNNYGFGIPNALKANEILKNYSFDLNSSDYWTSAVISPNPATSFLKIEWVSPVEEQVKIKLIDVLGRTQLDQEISSTEGFNSISFPIYQYRNGWYILQLNRGENSLIRKVVFNTPLGGD